MDAMKILIAARDPELRTRLRVGLQSAGELVAETADGREALLAETRMSPLKCLPCVTILAPPNQTGRAIDTLRRGAFDFLETPVRRRGRADERHRRA